MPTSRQAAISAIRLTTLNTTSHLEENYDNNTDQDRNASDEDHIIAVVVLAFSADPVARWTYPDPHEYLSYFPDIVRALGGKAFAHGTAYYVDGFSGAALWLSPDVQPQEDEMTALLHYSSEPFPSKSGGSILCIRANE